MKRNHIIALGAATLAVVALFAWGTIAGAAEVMGMVAAKGAAAIEADDQPGATDELVIERVVAPRGSWIVVHLEKGMGMPGKRVGIVRVPKGVSDDVRVPLKGAKLTDRLIAAVHVDRGVEGEFEFDMARMEHSPDKPYFVGGMEVAVVVEAR